MIVISHNYIDNRNLTREAQGSQNFDKAAPIDRSLLISELILTTYSASNTPSTTGVLILHALNLQGPD